MRAVARLALAAALFDVGYGTASAHRLKLFAAAAGNTISGYGFFVGGGRVVGAPIVARDAAGAEIWHGATAEDGTFAFYVAAPGPVTLTLDAGDGHAAGTTLTLAATDAPMPAASPALPTQPDTVSVPVPAVSASAPPDFFLAEDRTLAPLIAAEIDRAVARQIRPLLEASAAAEARIRINDVLGGLGWIAGLMGTALFFLRRKQR